MVAIKKKIAYLPDGQIDIEAWLEKNCLKKKNSGNDPENELLKKTISLVKTTCKGLTTFYGQPCLEQGLEIAEILLDLGLDHTSAAAALLTCAVKHASLTLETISEKINPETRSLVSAVLQMEILQTKNRDPIQMDRLKKMFLAMMSDIRVVLIKLAERTCMMRGIKKINSKERKRIAQETVDLYAPLANRLGIGQVKWELEDLSFRYLDPDAYKTISQFLSERRDNREQRIRDHIHQLKTRLTELGIDAKISGRAKHIFSIYLKMKKKHLDLKNIYDYSAVRILVPTLEDCYSALGIAHSLWQHLPAEFDDYISHPKPNGYRSIHTAVVDTDGKVFEIQIRTSDMHKEAEQGIAAHWLYKENKVHLSGYEAKITFLRHLLDWHKEIAQQKKDLPSFSEKILEDRTYVFTPEGDIVDLPREATPLDFAYHVHSEIGNRCRGAKVSGHIVPLTHLLKTGDQIEILTNPKGTPSRDWLRLDSGYLKTSRARAKVAHWFRQHDAVKQQSILPKSEMISSEHKIPTTIPLHLSKKIPQTSQLGITGIDDLLMRFAKCCKPIPGDPIIGFITQGRGVSIHKKTCNNMTTLSVENEHRLIPVAWNSTAHVGYYVDIQVRAEGQTRLLHEVTTLITNAKIDLINLNSTINKKNNILNILLTIQIHDTQELQLILNRLQQLPEVMDATRVNG